MKIDKYKTLTPYCLKCKKKKKKKTERMDPRVSKTNNNKIMLLSKCVICGTKKSRFIKKRVLGNVLI